MRTPAGRTPTYRELGAKTPLHGAATPVYEAGARTPHYGASTPAHEGARTPAHGAWDPSAAATPARTDFDYGLDDSPGPAYDPPPTYSQQAGPFTPQTPGTMYGSDHTYSPYQPSPAGYLGTPSPGYSPRSPAGEGEWLTTEVEVRVREHEEPALVGQAGALRGLSAGSAAVFLPREGRVLSLPHRHLEPVPPHSGDRVKVIAGEDREAVGQLISIENQEGVVKFGTDDIKIMQLRHLCKMSSV